MAVSSGFADYVLEQLEGCGGVRSRRMFGATGVYVDDVFCAIITGSGRFYLRVGDANRPDFEKRGMEQFRGRGDAKMPYFEVPEDVLEDAGELFSWVAKARAAAAAAQKGKKRPKSRPRG